MAHSRKPTTVNLEQALLDPGSVFDTPEALLLDGSLSRQQKTEILRRWAYDASESSVAVEEGMPDDGSDLLRRVLLGLNQLTGGVDVEKGGPTKHHGIPRSAIKSE